MNNRVFNYRIWSVSISVIVIIGILFIVINNYDNEQVMRDHAMEIAVGLDAVIANISAHIEHSEDYFGELGGILTIPSEDFVNMYGVEEVFVQFDRQKWLNPSNVKGEIAAYCWYQYGETASETVIAGLTFGKGYRVLNEPPAGTFHILVIKPQDKDTIEQ